MANDINLPNLVSHLQVELGNTSGIVADAARQGSSVGAALGASLQREIRDSVDNIPDVQIDANSSQLDQDLHRVRGELDELANQRIGVDISVEAALRKLAELEPHLDRLSHEHTDLTVQATTAGALRQLAALRVAAAAVPDEVNVRVDVDVDNDTVTRTGRLTGLLGGLGDMGRRTSTALLPLVGTVAKTAGVLGTVIPAAAGVVATLVDVAPAAALAVTGLIAVKLASTTVKIAMSGVGDAVKAALDPSDPKAYAEALKKLSPNARAFVGEIHKLSPDLAAVKKSVQDRVFAGLDKQLTDTATVALPVLRGALDRTAGTLNRMAKGVASSVRGLGKDGSLDTALKGATSGLTAFQRVPGQVVTALGHIGAAAAPSFARLSKEGAGVLDKISSKLDKAFTSGAMEKAIDQAISLLGTLFHVLGNVGSIFGSVFGAAQSEGGGMLGVLEDITGELAKIAKSDGVQAGLKAIFSVMSTLGRTVAPLLGQALTAIGPVFAALGPPVETLIENLGAGLSPVIDALAPVLLSASQAVGALIVAASPLLPVIGELAASLLPALTPLLDACTTVFTELAPIVQQLADTLRDTLSPILAALPALVGPLADLFAVQLGAGLQLFGDLLTELSPSLITLGESCGELLVALTPLIEAWAQMSTELLTKVMPVVSKLVVYLADDLASTITDVVVPAVELVSAILNGDFSGAVDAAKRLLSGLVSNAVDRFTALPNLVAQAMAALAPKLRQKADEAGAALVGALVAKRNEAIRSIAALPDRARAALGNLGGVLASAGRSLINGFIQGIRNQIPSVQGTLSKLTSMIPDWKGPKKKDAQLLTPAGKLIIKGLVAGIDASTASLKSKLTSVTTLIERAITVNSGNKKKVSGLGSLLATVGRDNAQLLKLAKNRDAVAAKLKAATTKLSDLVKARAKVAADISGGILDSANITSGNGVTNSVTAITVGLQQVLAKTTAFAANIAALKKKGLRSDLLQDIADAGVDGGAATADALAKATPGELKRINDLQSQLAKAASTTGSTVAGALYDSGVKAAQGLVDGLKKQQGAIEKQMEKIATAMVKALKKALDMHSASRKLRALASLAMAGMPQGFEDMRQTVARSAGSVASAAVAAASGAAARVTPYLPSAGALSVAVAGGGAVGDTHNTFNLYQSEASADGILRALSWRGLVGRR